MRKVGRLRWIVGCVVVLLGCDKPDGDDAPPVQPALSVDSTARYLRQAVAVSDTAGTAQLSFPETEYDFGRIRAGRTVRHQFAFTNTGPGPVRILAVTTTCGCTVGSYPTQPIDSGAQSAIEVIFTSQDKEGQQHRPVVVRATTVPAHTTLYLSGQVIP